MTETPLFIHPLIHHPATPCEAVRALVVEAFAVPLNQASGLLLRYRLTGDLSRLRLPVSSEAPRFTDGLWQHTCFEAFIAEPAKAAYREFNFSPSGHWAVYAFSGERVRDASNPGVPSPAITLAQTSDSLTLEARLPMPVTAADTPLPVGLTAVIETQDGNLSYWALHHPAERPDFHRNAGWTAELA
ncbi:MAG: DOMON-like domain-containing protein [Ottowia sp.]|uniref:DOMON-like domain-containing protein n=1 Tax=Ottowia sp. TaxID=1898956 RepID=UPI003C79041B